MSGYLSLLLVHSYSFFIYFSLYLSSSISVSLPPSTFFPSLSPSHSPPPAFFCPSTPQWNLMRVEGCKADGEEGATSWWGAVGSQEAVGGGG